MGQIWANRGLTSTLKCDILQTMEPKIHIPIEVQKLDALASACKKATNPDFKALWYTKMIELAHKYKLMDYVMKKGLKH